MAAIRGYRIEEYVTGSGKCPFRAWLDSLDVGVRARVQARVFRFESGNLGDHKPVGSGVLEARLDFGPGYRIYFGIEGGRLILLLIGGDKSTQRKDIRMAQDLWMDFQENKK